MKHILSFFLTLVVVVAFVGQSLAYPRAIEKLKDGAKDVITSPLVVKDHVTAETQDAKFLPFALTGGLLKGVFYMGKQVVTGAWAMATSPLEITK